MLFEMLTGKTLSRQKFHTSTITDDLRVKKVPLEYVVVNLLPLM